MPDSNGRFRVVNGRPDKFSADKRALLAGGQDSVHNRRECFRRENFLEDLVC